MFAACVSAVGADDDEDDDGGGGAASEERQPEERPKREDIPHVRPTADC